MSHLNRKRESAYYLSKPLNQKVAGNNMIARRIYIPSWTSGMYSSIDVFSFSIVDDVAYLDERWNNCKSKEL